MTTITSAEKAKKPRQNGRSLSGILVPAFLVLVGICVLLYPVVSTQWNNLRQIEIAQNYAAAMAKVPSDTKNVVLEEADSYNHVTRSGPVFDPWLTRLAPDNAQYNEYLATLDGENGAPMSRLVIPKAKVDLPVYHGSSDYTLQHGVGHLFGSSLPVGGPSTHSVLTGHTGLTNATLFDNLIKLKEGDAFYIDTFGREMKYVVDKIDVVLPDKTNDLKVQPDQDLVTLVTCTPYGINSHRLLVRGHRVALDPQQASETFDKSGASKLTWQWWMLVALALAGLALLILLWWVITSLIALGRQRRGDLTVASSIERRS